MERLQPFLSGHPLILCTKCNSVYDDDDDKVFNGAKCNTGHAAPRILHMMLYLMHRIP